MLSSSSWCRRRAGRAGAAPLRTRRRPGRAPAPCRATTSSRPSARSVRSGRNASRWSDSPTMLPPHSEDVAMAPPAVVQHRRVRRGVRVLRVPARAHRHAAAHAVPGRDAPVDARLAQHQRRQQQQVVGLAGRERAGEARGCHAQVRRAVARGRHAARRRRPQRLRILRIDHGDARAAPLELIDQGALHQGHRVADLLRRRHRQVQGRQHHARPAARRNLRDRG